MRLKVQNFVSVSLRSARFWFLAVVLVVAALFVSVIPTHSVSADDVVILHPNPLHADIVAGQATTVDIVVENIQNFYGAQVYLQFDPTIVEVVDANPVQPGIQVTTGSFLQPDFVQANQADNSLGTIDYVITQLNPTPPVNGSGTLFSIKFLAKTAAQQTLLTRRTSPPTILAVVVGPQVTAPIPYQWQNGLGTISEFPPYIYYFPVVGRSN